MEDEDGLINLIVRPQIHERYREVLRNSPLLWAEGLLQREDHATSVLVHSAGSLMSDTNGDAGVIPARLQGRSRRQTM